MHHFNVRGCRSRCVYLVWNCGRREFKAVKLVDNNSAPQPNIVHTFQQLLRIKKLWSFMTSSGFLDNNGSCEHCSRTKTPDLIVRKNNTAIISRIRNRYLMPVSPTHTQTHTQCIFQYTHRLHMLQIPDFIRAQQLPLSIMDINKCYIKIYIQINRFSIWFTKYCLYKMLAFALIKFKLLSIQIQNYRFKMRITRYKSSRCNNQGNTHISSLCWS